MTNLIQIKAGLDLRPTVRWHDMHAETLEGFGEASKTSGGDTAVIRFDKTRRRLRGGCFIDMERVDGRTVEYRNTRRPHTER
jgi:hypothetical protein